MSRPPADPDLIREPFGTRDAVPHARSPGVLQFRISGHGPLYTILIAGWLLLSLAGFAYLFKDAHAQLEAHFNELVDAEASAIKAQLRTNEAVIGGFASFLSALSHPTYQQASDYARNVLAGFPHIYMLETAEAVPRRAREQFRSSLSEKSGPLAIRTFSYDTTRQFQTPTEVPVYFPLTFLAPDFPNARPALGLDLATAPPPHLRETLLTALSAPGARSTRPFELIEGGLAYVMMQQVPPTGGASLTPGALPVDGRLALLVVRAIDLAPARSPRPLARTLWAMRDNAPVTPPLLVAEEPGLPNPVAQRFLPRLTRDIDDHGTSQSIRLRLSRQMRLDDFDAAAWRSVTLVSLLSLALILLYLRQHHQQMQQREADYAQAGALGRVA